MLVTTRSTCAWGALGHAVAAYDAALTYSKQRTQFGKPLAGFQIVQERLVQMLAEVTGMQLYCMQLARLEEAGRLTDTIAGLAKLNNTRKAREVIADARDMLGGNGVLLENHVIRHMGDIEVDPHLRGHRDHAGAHRRPRHHRHRRLRMSLRNQTLFISGGSPASGLASRVQELEEQFAPALGGVDRRAVAGALEELDLHAAAGVAVALEHRADLGDHRLRREDVLAGPAGDRAHLAERPDLPGRAVGDDDVRAAVRPQDRRLGLQLDDVRPVAVAAPTAR